MLESLGTLRSRLLAAMIGTALVALVLAYLLVGHLLGGDEQSADQAKAHEIATALSRRVAQSARGDRDDLEAASIADLSALLPDDQLVVRLHGRRLYSGPPPAGRRLELSAAARFPGGTVTVRDYTGPKRGPSVTATAVAAGVAAVVILAAIVAATLLTRAVRVPVRRAIAAADRLAAGDLSARMGTTGPEELAHLGRAFDGMAQRLQSVDRDQRRFLADVAHEIATPTNTISGFGLALADGTIQDPAQRAEAAELIEHETARLRALLDDLRELTRLDLAATVHRRLVDLGAMGERLRARFERDARAAGVRFSVHFAGAPIVSDERLLDMILGNLVANAIRHTPPGGQVRLSRGRRRQHREVVLSVADTGVGIAAEHRERIFDRLYRIDSARARDPGGSGLGLPIAQRAAHALGGRIELSSAPRRGSEFHLIVPDDQRAVRQDPVPD
jgi:signal transduction histidine kinase